MKRISIGIICWALITGTAFAVPTTHRYFDKPPYGAYGPAYYLAFNAALDATDIFLHGLEPLPDLIANWVGTVDTLTLIETSPGYSAANTFTLAGDFSTVLTAGKRLVADCGADGLKPNTVVSCTYAAPTSTVVVTAANLTANLAAVSYYATRNGLNTYGSGDVVAAEYGAPSWANLQSAVAVANASGRRLVLTPGTWPVTDNLAITAPLHPVPGALLQVATTKTLTVSGAFDAGLYQAFSCVGTGAVAGLKQVYPQWFGALGNGSADDTAALTATSTAATVGGVIHLAPGTYKTTGWLIIKTVSLVAETPFLYGSGSQTATLKAAGAQAYVLKLQGAFAADATTFLHPRLRNINIDGDDQAISDAAFIMEYCHLARLDGCSFQNTAGHGVRLRTVWELRMRDYFVHRCGSLDTGAAVFIDGPAPLDYGESSNNVAMIGGVWSSNKGRWLQVSSLANLDGFWFEGNKLELDDLTILNTVNTDVLRFGSLSRGMILNNTFATFGASYGKYVNLIWIGGVNDDGNNGAAGAPSNVVRGNRHYAQAGSGAINGLSLAANAPSCVEENNNFVSNAAVAESCLNVNVSTFPQLINRTWRNFSTSLFPLTPLPDREQPGFLSIHQVSRGTYARPFIADANCANNAGTVLKLVPADMGAPPLIFCHLDLSRWIGHKDKYLKVRMRVRLDAAGSITLAVNLAGGWAPASVAGITSTAAWTWVEFAIPVSTITAADHLLDGYWISTESGTPNLLIDGMEFATSNSGSPTTPAVAASTIEVRNTTTYPVLVTITGGTVTVIAKGPTTGSLVTTGATAGTFILEPNEYIAITYSVAPTWVWAGM